MSTTTTIPIPDPYPVKVHHYPSTSPTSQNRPAQAYEHLPTSPSPSQKQEKSALIFLGGLGDGPHTIPYVRHLASRLHAQQPGGYSVFEARLSSAFAGFGFGSLAQDAREVADLVRYLRGPAVGVKRVVLMGHSTGCQGCLEYGTRFVSSVGGDGREGVRVDGLVLQGPVSDREAIGMGEDGGVVQAALGVAEGMLRMGKGGEVMATEVLPAGFRGSPVTAYRWASLAGVG
jgi:pimeloyl-ACP methyl ester carboxylesterase